MSLIDMVTGALNQGGAGGSQPIVQMLMQVVSSPGGLQGLLKTLQDHGLGAQVASWLGQSPNLPVSGEQIAQALGNGGILTQIAKQLGQSEPAVAEQVAGTLPNLVHTLSPQGQLPEGDLLSQGLDLLKGRFFG